MLEVIALILLTRSIGTLALKKGEKPGKWKFFTILAWFVFEIVGLCIAFVLFGAGNLIGLMLFGLASAFGGYLIVHAILHKLPDADVNDWLS